MALLGAAAAVCAQDSTTGAKPAGLDDSILDAPADANKPEEDSLLDRPQVPVLKPQGYTESHKGPALPLPGSQVLDRRCRVVKVEGTGWYMLDFEPGAAGARRPDPRLVLPNKFLEQIEQYVDRTPPVILRVSGEACIYRQKSFLLLTEVTFDTDQTHLEATSDANVAPPRVSDGNGLPLESLASATAATASAATMSASTTQQATTGPVGPKYLSSDQVLNRLLRARAGLAIATPVRTTEPSTRPSVAPPARLAPIQATRGAMVVDRVVRVLPEENEGWWTVQFEADNTLRESPIRVLPGDKLEWAETNNQNSRGMLKFSVTGELLEYKGRQYLLLRNVRREHDMGQF